MRLGSRTIRTLLAASLAGLGSWSPLRCQTLSDMTLARAHPVVLEAEALAPRAISTEGEIRRQEMAPFGPGWSDGAQLFWTPGEPGARLLLEFDVEHGGSYDAILSYTTAPDYAQIEAQIDDGPGVGLDGYGVSVARSETRIGTVDLAPGTHRLIVTVTGSAPSSSGHFVGLDRLVLRPAAGTPASGPPPVAPPAPPLDPWTANDVVDSRIDVAAQRVLISGLSSDGERREVSSGLVSAIKEGMLGGIYQEDQAVPARLALARGIGWWQLIPAGREFVLIAPSIASELPVAAFRRALAGNPERLAAALAALWTELGAPRSKDARCAGPVPGPACDTNCDEWRRDINSFTIVSAEQHLRDALGFTTIPPVASVTCKSAPNYFGAGPGRLCTVRYQGSALVVEVGMPEPPRMTYCGCNCVFVRQYAPVRHHGWSIYACLCPREGGGLRLRPTGGVQPNPYADPHEDD